VILAVIPARGGSKGIPRKNLRRILGVPLVTHSIRHAQESVLVDHVIVSTDDDEIVGVSSAAGADVVRRPPEIAGDTASSESALLHALDVLADRQMEEPELVVFLQATSPVRRPDHIDGAIRLLWDGDYDSVFSSSPNHGFVWEVQDGEDPVPLTYEPSHRPMRQEIGERLVENGSIYVVKTRVLRETGLRLGGRIGVYRMGFLEGLQIDEPEDLELIERVLGGEVPASQPNTDEGIILKGGRRR